MKKITSIILALTFAVCAYAKTLDELTAEYTAVRGEEHAKTETAQKWWISENSADLKVAFEKWKVLDVAKNTLLEPKFAEITKNFTSEQKEAINMQKAMFKRLYQLEKGNLKADARVLILLSTHVYAEVMSVENPSFYSEIKAADWVVGGEKLMPTYRVLLACFSNDSEYLISVPQQDLRALEHFALVEYVKRMTGVLIDMPDAAAAKTICKRIKATLIKRGITGEMKAKIESVDSELTKVLMESKILGK